MRDCAATHSEQLQNLSVTCACVSEAHFQVIHTFPGATVSFMTCVFADCLFVALTEGETMLTWNFVDRGKDRSAGGRVVGRPS